MLPMRAHENLSDVFVLHNIYVVYDEYRVIRIKSITRIHLFS